MDFMSFDIMDMALRYFGGYFNLPTLTQPPTTPYHCPIFWKLKYGHPNACTHVHLI